MIGMDSQYIVMAIPFFLLTIALEAYLMHRRKQPVYRYHDTLANLGNGIGSQVLGFLVGALGIVAYAAVLARFGLFQLSLQSIPTWIAVFLLDDFLYYLYHWASHRVNFLWATHSVHHQSEEYNLSAALRQSWFTGFTSFVFYLPLAVLGVPVVMFVVVRTLNTLYQFWIHTRSVGRLGVLEWFLNTPSHHRVHHGIEPAYIDKNHGGVFIVWDRLFGTFVPESSEPVYGLVSPLASYNPLWANVAEFSKLWKISRQTQHLRDKLLIWVKPPEWRPADCGGIATVPPITRAEQRKYDVEAPLRVNVYAGATFLVVMAAAVLYLGIQAHLPWPMRLLYVAEVVAGLLTVSALTESKRWALSYESARLASLTAVALFIPRPYGLLLLGLSFVQVLGLLALRQKPTVTSASAAPPVMNG